QKAAGAGAERLVDVFVAVESGHDDDPGRVSVLLGEDLASRLEAVDIRHPDIHEHHVDPQTLSKVDRLPAVRGFSDYVDVRLRGEDHSEARPHELLVVRDQDADAHALPFRGTRASTA